MRGTRLAGAIIILSLPLLAIADVVVLKNGQRIETKGPYDVQGGVVQFLGTDGQRHYLPAESVDLEASRQASAGAGRGTHPRPRVWTNEEIDRLGTEGVSVTGTVAAAAPAQAEGEAAAGEEQPAGESPPAEVTPRDQTPEYWQERMQPLREELTQIEQQLRQLRRGQGQAVSNSISILGTNPGVQVEDTIRQLERRRTEIMQQMDDIRAEARRKGVPPGYVR